MARMSEDERLRRQAARKADRANAKAKAEAGPLFADQVPQQTDAEAEYWKIRQTWANTPRGMSAADLALVNRKWDIRAVRRIAAQHMSQADHAVAIAADHKHGDTLMFWRNILTGNQRLVLSYWRHVFGCRTIVPQRFPDHWTSMCSGEPFTAEKRVDIGEALVWPPPGWQPPLTKEQFDALVAIPEAEEFASVDPWGLADI